MAFEVRFARIAEDDRDVIVDYLLNVLKNPQAASNFLDAVDGALDILESNPYLYGISREPRLNQLSYRSCPCMNYLVLYKVEGDKVRIGRIVHSLQDYARLI